MNIIRRCKRTLGRKLLARDELDFRKASAVYPEEHARGAFLFLAHPLSGRLEDNHLV